MTGLWLFYFTALAPNSQFHVHPYPQELPCWGHQECLDQHGQNCFPISSQFSLHLVHVDKHKGGVFILISIKTLWNSEYWKFSSHQYSSTHRDHALSNSCLAAPGGQSSTCRSCSSHTHKREETDSNHVQTFSCPIKNNVSKNVHQLCKCSQCNSLKPQLPSVMKQQWGNLNWRMEHLFLHHPVWNSCRINMVPPLRLLYLGQKTP